MIATNCLAVGTEFGLLPYLSEYTGAAVQAALVMWNFPNPGFFIKIDKQMLLLEF